jgi:hypothetical protein
MLHACVQRFDVTENLENFWEGPGEVDVGGWQHVIQPAHAWLPKEEDGFEASRENGSHVW